LPPGLTIAGVLPREEPLDAVVLPARAEGIGHRRRGDAALGPLPSALTRIDDLMAHLGQAPSIGTGSVRRIAQLTRLFPGARFTPIRGNLDTRLRKLDEGAHDALVLAAAGLRRLGFGQRISLALPADACITAPGQGIVAIEIRDGDARVGDAVARISDAAAAAALVAERALVEALGGGCQTPVGALALPADGGRLDLVAGVFALDGSRVVRAQAQAGRDEAAALGAHVGAELLQRGAGDILAEAARTTGAAE